MHGLFFSQCCQAPGEGRPESDRAAGRQAERARQKAEDAEVAALQKQAEVLREFATSEARRRCGARIDPTRAHNLLFLYDNLSHA